MLLCFAAPASAAASKPAPERVSVKASVSAAEPELSAKKAWVCRGSTVTIRLKNGSRSVKWSTAKPGTIRILKKGRTGCKIRGLRNGRAVLRCKTGGKSLTCTVTVETPSLSDRRITLTTGQSATLSVLGSTAKNRYTNSHPGNVEAVRLTEKKIRLKALKKGVSYITFTINGAKYQCRIQVVPPEPAKPLATTYLGLGQNSSQDGAAYGGYLFSFAGNGVCRVMQLPSLKAEASFALDRPDLFVPHANSACFGPDFFEPGDPFPLLYLNVYNNYRYRTDRREGVCLVYRILKDGDNWSSRLMQIIRIGFTENRSLWKSLEGRGDLRPYGNFVVNRENRTLIAFVPRDANRSMRYFIFRLPRVSRREETAAGEDPADPNPVHPSPAAPNPVEEVVLEPGDILTWFDSSYQDAIQGVCCHGGRLYSLFGLDTAASPASLAVVDLAKHSTEVIALRDLGLKGEPELIDMSGGDFIYGNVGGRVWTLRRQAGFPGTPDLTD